MLKSTHKSSQTSPPPPLPPGWTEHKAPTGHTYYYNPTTKQSTYTRPSAPLAPPPPPAHPLQAEVPFYIDTNPTPLHLNPSFQSSSSPFPPRSDFHSQGRGRGGFRGRGAHHHHSHGGRDHHHQADRPKTKHAIPGCVPWVLVKTRLGRRFVHNVETGESLWKFPAEVMRGVVEFDRGERERRERAERGEGSGDEHEDEDRGEGEGRGGVGRRGEEEERVWVPPVKGGEDTPGAKQGEEEGGADDSEYEEVEVTDDEGEEDEDGENLHKRQRLDGDGNEEPQGPVEFNEDDIAYQLAAMGADYGLDPGEYGDEDMQEDGDAGLPLTEEDSLALFTDLLQDYQISPFSTWDSLISNERILEDDRWVSLPTSKARQAAFSDWCTRKIAEIKEVRAKQEKKDPKIPYLAFLAEHATPKLYWVEFKRKFKKEAVMRDTKLSEKDKEKLYRDLVNRLKLPQSTLKSDLSTMLKATPLRDLNSSTTPSSLPPSILTDLRYISLPAKTRDPLIEAYISTLSPPPTNALSAEEEAENAKRAEERDRRERALRERQKAVEEEKRKVRREMAQGERRLRENEMEVEAAMRVGRGGLRAQLEVGDRIADAEGRDDVETR